MGRKSQFRKLPKRFGPANRNSANCRIYGRSANLTNLSPQVSGFAICETYFATTNLWLPLELVRARRYFSYDDTKSKSLPPYFTTFKNYVKSYHYLHMFLCAWRDSSPCLQVTIVKVIFPKSNFYSIKCPKDWLLRNKEIMLMPSVNSVIPNKTESEGTELKE